VNRLWFSEIIFQWIYIFTTYFFVGLIVLLIIQLSLYTTKINSNKKGLLITIVFIVLSLLGVYFIKTTFGIYLIVNIAIYNNIIIQTLQVLISFITVLLFVYLILIITLYAFNINRKNIKPRLIFVVSNLIGIIVIVFWLYINTGLMLFVNLGPYIY